ncbi:MAG: hypothetical protein AAGU75_06745, partial [Bacillota bacterium]
KTRNHISYIAEANQKKRGLCTIGTASQSSRGMNDYESDEAELSDGVPMVLYEVFRRKESKLLARGTRILMPQP